MSALQTATANTGLSVAGMKPTLLERVEMCRIGIRKNSIATFRQRFMGGLNEASINFVLGLMVVLAALSLSFLVGLAQWISVSSFALLLLTIGFLFLPHTPTLWSRRMVKSLKRIGDMPHCALPVETPPREILDLMLKMGKVTEPELLVLGKLPISDTLHMIRLSRTLEGIRPGIHQGISFQISGETSEVLSRVSDALSGGLDKVVVRL